MLQLRNITDVERDEIEALLAMDKSSVYQELSPYIGNMGFKQDFEEWINSKKDELHKLICVEGKYCEFMSEHRNVGAVNLVAALADLLLPKFGVVIPVNALSVAFMQWGIAELCEC